MRKFARILTVGLFCGAILGAAAVHAQDPTTTPASDATSEATVAPTSEGTVEATMEMTAETTAAPSSGATAVPTGAPTAEATQAAGTGTTASSSGLVVCDSGLILDLYVAEHYFGFDAVATAAMNGSTTSSTMADVSKFDKGQFDALFAAPMTTTPNMMTQDQIQSAASMMTMDDATMMNQMATMMPANPNMNSMTTLPVATVAGEDPMCTELRTELNRFYMIVAFQGMQSGMNMGEATAEATSSASTGSTAQNVNLSTNMTGANEVPPADPDGTGTAAVTIDMANSQVCYTLGVQNITLPATMAHIHRGAVGVSGPIVVPFDLAPDANGNATSCVKADAALLQEIAANPANFYVNVHTTDFPNGAVRGQLP